MSTDRVNANELQPRSAIITLFGIFVVPMGNWIAVADLVALLAELGLEDKSVRAAVARLKKADLLVAVERGAAGYSATPDLLAVFERGDERIFSSQVPANLKDGWILVLFSVPESRREERHRLRSILGSLGFGSVASGVWIAPRRTRGDAERVLKRAGLDDYVRLFTADYVGFEDVAELTESVWRSSVLESEYQAFTDVYQSSIGNWNDGGASGVEAFGVCMTVLEHWRSLTYSDPGLPDEIQSGSAQRTQARELFAEIGAQMEPQATAYVRERLDP